MFQCSNRYFKEIRDKLIQCSDYFNFVIILFMVFIVIYIPMVFNKFNNFFKTKKHATCVNCKISQQVHTLA